MNREASISHVGTIKLQYMKSIDPTDYYNHAQELGFIFCQICNVNIAMPNVFEHSTTKRHKYNKLLFGIAQGLSSNIDMDFIVLHIDRLQCRYCDLGIIESDREAFVIDHIQDVRHCTKRQSYLDRTDAGSSLKPLDVLISYTSNIEKGKNPISQTRESRDNNGFPMHEQKNQASKIDVLNTVYLNENNSSDYICLIEHQIVCKLCRTFLPEHSLITDHVNSEKHKENIPQTSGLNSSTNAGNLKTGVLSKHADSGLVHIVDIDNVKACKICRRVISTLPGIHVRTKKHRAMMQKVDERLIGFEDVEKLWVCKVCEKIFPKSKEFTHIYSYKHLRKIEASS